MSADVAIARLVRRNYKGLGPPFRPGQEYPEIRFIGDETEGHEFAPNDLYRGVRALFRLYGLDRERFGSEAWNPLGAFINPGDRVVLKPNWVRHYNSNKDRLGSLDSVVTHPALYRPVIDYALKATGPGGRVIVADAPQMDCQLDVLMDYLRVEDLVDFYRRRDFRVEWRDLRDETVIFEDGLVKDRTLLDGDPDGYEIVNIGDASAFEISSYRGGVEAPIEADRLRSGLSHADGVEESLLRGADYDEEETIRHHSGGRHEYKVSKTILTADVVINLPKVKTHKKAGVTLALKNLVGINCNKNFLPHHRAGCPSDGGDEHPGDSVYQKLRSWAIEFVRPLLKRDRFMPVLRILRKFDLMTRPDRGIRSGNWLGNDTIWRTIIDLNRILFFADRDGRVVESGVPQRRVLHIFEGIVAAQGEGPMAGEDTPLGVLTLSEDPIAGDLVVCQMMGLDWRKIPKIRAALAATELRFTRVDEPDNVEVSSWDEASSATSATKLSEFTWNFGLRPHFGWEGYLELGREGRRESPAA